MIAVVRIHGRVDVNQRARETLDRLRIRKKLNCVFIDEKDAVLMGMVRSVKDYIMYGSVSKEFVDRVVEARGELKDKSKKSKKTLENIKPWIRLHPPRGGFKKSTKLQVPKGIIGRHEDITKLIERML
jgi:large subunit ribosomal protein L30